MDVEDLALDALVLDPANVRKHSERNIETIKGSLARWGQQKPIVVDKDDVVVAGNGTVEAARLLGWQTIRVVRTTLKGSDRTAYAIADNRSAELAEWDDGLAAALASLQQDGVLEDVEVTGFTEAEIAELIAADLEPPVITEDSVPAVPVEAVTCPGDLWLCGEHRVLCGDSTKAEDVGRVMVPSLLMVTDPPYGVDYAGGSKPREKLANDAGDIRDLLVAAWRLTPLEPGGAFYVSAPAGPTETEFRLALQDAGLEHHQTIAWVKNNATFGPMGQDYHWRHETILYGWKPGAAHSWHGDRKADTVWQVDRPTKSPEHPTMKPVALVARAIGNSSKVGQVVLDLFLGSGTTMIAAEQLKRRCYGIEIEPRYVDVCCRRYYNQTGQSPVRESDGAKFAELADVNGNKESKCANRPEAIRRD